jgi:hypothetical protein
MSGGIESDWAALVETLQGVLERRIGLAEGSAIVARLRRVLGQQQNDMFLPFVGIDSELHMFPTGNVRERWSSDALSREDKERARLEQHYMPMAVKAIAILLPYSRERLLTHAGADRDG